MLGQILARLGPKGKDDVSSSEDISGAEKSEHCSLRRGCVELSGNKE